MKTNAWILACVASGVLVTGTMRSTFVNGQPRESATAASQGVAKEPASPEELSLRVQRVLSGVEPPMVLLPCTGFAPREIPALDVLIPQLGSDKPAMRDTAWDLLMHLPNYVVCPLKDSTPYLDRRYPLNVRMGALVFSLDGAVPANVKKLEGEAYLKAMEKTWADAFAAAMSEKVTAPYLPQAVGALGLSSIPVERVIEPKQQRMALRRALAGMVESYVSDAYMQGISLVAIDLECGPEEIAAWYVIAPSAKAREQMLVTMAYRLQWSDKAVVAAYRPVLEAAEKDWVQKNVELAKEIRKQIDGMR